MAKRICSVGECDGVSVTRGWCSKHYQRWWAHGDPLMLKTKPRWRRSLSAMGTDAGFVVAKSTWG